VERSRQSTGTKLGGEAINWCGEKVQTVEKLKSKEDPIFRRDEGRQIEATEKSAETLDR